MLLPDPTIKRVSTIRLEGEIPSPIDLPPGCPLAGRCPFADDALPAREAAAGRRSRPITSSVAFTIDKVAAVDQTIDHFARFQEESTRLLSVGAG